MALAHPSHDAFISAVKQAVKALRIEYPERVIALECDDKGIVVRLIDVSSRDARGVAAKGEIRAEDRRDLRSKIAELLPFEYAGDELVFLNERRPGTSRYRWTLWDAQRWCPEKVRDDKRISLEYVTGP